MFLEENFTRCEFFINFKILATVDFSVEMPIYNSESRHKKKQNCVLKGLEIFDGYNYTIFFFVLFLLVPTS